ncbi:MAG: hypothetical protein KAG53_00120 [Endozoicomonadaceae bacterium]|nr:hypothetical protein [Endozoicomonadaceae bacterium]
MDLIALSSDISLVGWLLIAIGIACWIVFCHFMGAFSEKRWGDRESGALLGFFAPGLFIFVFWLIH